MLFCVWPPPGDPDRPRQWDNLPSTTQVELLTNEFVARWLTEIAGRNWSKIFAARFHGLGTLAHIGLAKQYQQCAAFWRPRRPQLFATLLPRSFAQVTALDKAAAGGQNFDWLGTPPVNTLVDRLKQGA